MLAAVASRVTLGHVSDEKLNKQSKCNLTPTSLQGCQLKPRLNHRLTQKILDKQIHE